MIIINENKNLIGVGCLGSTYILEINEHRIYEDSYSKNERENISYMEPFTNNIFPLKIN